MHIVNNKFPFIVTKFPHLIKIRHLGEWTDRTGIFANSSHIVTEENRDFYELISHEREHEWELKIRVQKHGIDITE